MSTPFPLPRSHREKFPWTVASHLAAWRGVFLTGRQRRRRGGWWETDTFHTQISSSLFEKWAFFLFVHFCTWIENRIMTLCLKGKHQQHAFFFSEMLETRGSPHPLPDVSAFPWLLEPLAMEDILDSIDCVIGDYGACSVSSQIRLLSLGFSYPRHQVEFCHLPVFI